jgi:hypothetical protein
MLDSRHEPELSRGTSVPIFVGAEGMLRDNFNRRPFQFSHSLAGNPLFELPRLAELSETVVRVHGPGGVNWRAHDAPLTSRWELQPMKTTATTAAEAIRDLEHSTSWVLIYKAQTDPAYAAILEQIIDEAGALAGVPLRSQVSWKDTYIFLASPNAVTPYHIDHEVAFLCQVRGERTARVWDGTDRSVLTDKEIEDYYLGHLGAAIYKEEFDAKANVFPLAAGQGIHHPTCAPHAYVNGPQVSVAMGFHLNLRDLDTKARAYQVNGVLRRLGVRPTPPGVSSWRDTAKVKTLRLFDDRDPKTKFALIRSGIWRVMTPWRKMRGLLTSR